MPSHIQLHVGDKHGAKVLEELFDSGASLTVGARPYYAHPDNMANVKWFDRGGTPAPIPLRGVAKEGTTPLITVPVIYKLPYKSDGRPAVLHVVLTENFLFKQF